MSNILQEKIFCYSLNKSSLPYWKKLGSLNTFVPRNVFDGVGEIGSWPTLMSVTKKKNNS